MKLHLEDKVSCNDLLETDFVDVTGRYDQLAGRGDHRSGHGKRDNK